MKAIEILKNFVEGPHSTEKTLSKCDLVEQVLSLILCCRINCTMQKPNVLPL